MEETSVTIIGLLIASIIMFIVPIILIADRSDDISQLVIQTATTQFVDNVIKTGKITTSEYQKFINSIQSSGNNYEIDMEVKILDENTAKRVKNKEEPNKTGNNTYYSIFTSQIEDKIEISKNNPTGKLILKQGDGISVTVKNTSATLSQSLKSFYYRPTGGDIHIISATASGTITIDGTT